MPKKKNTRNAAGSGSIRQRPDGTWEGRYSAGTHPGTGKPMRKSVYGDSQREVVDKLAAISSGINAGTFIEPSKLTVSAWLDIWAAEYLGDVKPNTASKYKSDCKNHIIPSLGSVKLTVLSAHMIQTFINRLSPLSPKTIKNINGTLHKALQQAVEVGYIRFNPSDACKLPRIEKKEIQPLDEAEIAKFLTGIEDHMWESIYTFTLFTGMRQGEVLGLKWDCVDFEHGTVSIYRQLQKNRETHTWEIITPKHDKKRRITPAPSVMAVLWEQRRRQMEWRVKAGVAWQESGLVFTNELGRHLMPLTVYRHYKKLVADIGIPESRFHDLRHSYAVVALSSGDDIKTVQETLGHHTAAFTLDTYGHVTEQMKTESAARMESFIKGVKKSG